MTDLERQWDELPVRPAPVDRILRDAHREKLRLEAAAAARQPAPRLRRSLRNTAVLGGVAAAFVAGTLVTQPGDDGGPAGPGRGGAGRATPVAFQGALQAPESCDDLLAEYVERGVDQVGPYGWGVPSPYYVDQEVPLPTQGLAEAESSNSRDSAAPRVEGSYSSETGTTVQEEGVDEPDGVKTDGEVLVRLDGAELTTYDVRESRDGIERLGDVDLGDFHDGEILLAGDLVVAVGTDGTRPTTPVSYGYEPDAAPQTRVVTVDVSDPAAPAVVDTVDYDAATVTARQHGDVVRLVVSKGLPELDFVEPGTRGYRTERAALRHNQDLVRETTLDDWLPRQRTDGRYQQFLDCDAVALPRDELALGTTAVVGFGADDPAAVRALGVAGDAPLAYESPDHLYLASTGYTDVVAECWERCDPFGGAGDGTTRVYGFSLDGDGATYLGDGEVEGVVRDRWSMDEQDGVLRLAVGPSRETGNFNSVVMLRADDDRLVEVGRLDGLGRGEDIKSVRWFSDLAILVTFRQIDPLYAVDLSDQERPRLRGELKIPGFSGYLHPLGSRRLVGMGEGPGPGGWGAQAGFFDVTDVDRPRRLDVVHYGRDTFAGASQDPRQFTWLPGPRVALTVVSDYRRGSTAGLVSVIGLNAGKMTESRRVVEYGDDVAEVRTVPLPGDRVALVTGDDVELFDLDVK